MLKPGMHTVTAVVENNWGAINLLCGKIQTLDLVDEERFDFSEEVQEATTDTYTNLQVRFA